ncbi:protein SPEAR1-like [Aristolochia californica]|uniref:protein SPEAR1-like n=1 Tax=Aristolochia californica TaxID=171875 RepID=UPI0035D70121
MGSSYFGDPSLGNGRSGSSRKGKKSNSDKPKQPQRGLGVAQLEKIRLRNQMNSCYTPSLHGSSHPGFNQEENAPVEMALPSSVSSSSYISGPSFGYNPNLMVGVGDVESSDIRYGDSISTATESWNQNRSILQTQQSAQSSMTRHFLRLHAEDSSQKKRRQDRCDSMGSSSHNSDSSHEGQELDLELKLSL